MVEYSVGDVNRAVVLRNPTKIDLRGPTSVYDPDDLVSYFVIFRFFLM